MEIISSWNNVAYPWKEKNNGFPRSNSLEEKSCATSQDSCIDVQNLPKSDPALLIQDLTRLFLLETDLRIKQVTFSWEFDQEVKLIWQDYCTLNFPASYFRPFHHENLKKPYIQVPWTDLSMILEQDVMPPSPALSRELKSLVKIKREHTNLLKECQRFEKDYLQSLKMESQIAFDHLCTFKSHLNHLDRMKSNFQSNLAAFQGKISGLQSLDLFWKSAAEKFKEKHSSIDPVQLNALKSHVHHFLDDYVRQTQRLSQQLLQSIQHELSLVQQNVQEKLAPFLIQLFPNELNQKNNSSLTGQFQSPAAWKSSISLFLSEWNDFLQAKYGSLEKLSKYLPQNILTLSNHVNQIKAAWTTSSKQVGAWIELFSKSAIQKLTKQALIMRKNMFHNLKENLSELIPYKFLVHRLSTFIFLYVQHEDTSRDYLIDRLRAQFDPLFSEMKEKAETFKKALYLSLRTGWDQLQWVLHCVLRTTVLELISKETKKSIHSPPSASSSSLNSLHQFSEDVLISNISKKGGKTNSKQIENGNVTQSKAKQTINDAAIITSSENPPSISSLIKKETFKENVNPIKTPSPAIDLFNKIMDDQHLSPLPSSRGKASLHRLDKKDIKNSPKLSAPLSKNETTESTSRLDLDDQDMNERLKKKDTPKLLENPPQLSNSFLNTSETNAPKDHTLTPIIPIKQNTCIDTSSNNTSTVLNFIPVSASMSSCTSPNSVTSTLSLPPPPALSIPPDGFVSINQVDAPSLPTVGTISFPPPQLLTTSFPTTSSTSVSSLPSTTNTPMMPASSIWQPLPTTTFSPLTLSTSPLLPPPLTTASISTAPSSSVSSPSMLPPPPPTYLSSHPLPPPPSSSSPSLFETLMYENTTLKNYIYQLQSHLQVLENQLKHPK
ncbi:hypothetical protein HMI55_002446 [Coelomomyces lativittatus]|nr:hypothetical protein HMI55_002446 [Coelomomyces lativittatus]